MSSANQNVGRDELAAMLGASHASDMVAAAGTTANDLSTGGGAGAAAGAGIGGSRSKHYSKGGEAEADISRMDRAQAAALVARKFAGGAPAGGGIGATMRHRATGKRKRMLQHHLLVGDLMEKQQQGISSMEADDEENVADLYQKKEEAEEESFAIRADSGGAAAARRKKAEAQILLRRGDDGRRKRRGSSSASSSSDSSSSSSSDDSSHPSRSRRRSTNRRERGRNRRSRSNSSSSSEDEADIRRRRARERAQKNQVEDNPVSSDHGANNGKNPDKEKIIEEPKQQNHAKDNFSDEGDGNNRKEIKRGADPQHEKAPLANARNNVPDRRRRSRSDSSSSSGSGSSSSDSSSSSSDSSEESDHIVPISVSKPLFVPKSKRGTVAEVEAQQQKHEEAETRRVAEAEKRAIQSRALVAEAVSSAGKAGASNNDNDGDEFDTGEAGGEFIAVPDDTDPTEDDSPEKVLAERDAWEVRELIRILRDVDEALEAEKERKELERRRALSDKDRLEEDRRSGRYRAPGQSRKDGSYKGEKNNNYLQRFHHRGAFYMDEDTLAQAGADDVRHRAAEYSRAATGEDKIDKSALPEVMQVKNFGFAGYSTKYKGLAKEDTTDRKLVFLPIRGKKKGGEGSGGRGGRRDNGSGGGDDRGRYR